jgi:hypothetical protein
VAKTGRATDGTPIVLGGATLVSGEDEALQISRDARIEQGVERIESCEEASRLLREEHEKSRPRSEHPGRVPHHAPTLAADIRALELRIADRLAGRVLVLGHAPAIDRELLERADAEARSELDALGVKYKARDGSYADRWMKLPEDARGRSSLLEVLELPLPSASPGPMTPALLHPDLPTFIEKLNDKHALLVIDSSLAATNVGGYFDGVHLALRSDMPWHVFLHEFQHFEYHRSYGIFYSTVRMRLEAGGTHEEGLPREYVHDPRYIERFGAHVLEMKRLIERGLPDLAVNETMSVKAELDVLAHLPEWIFGKAYRFAAIYAEHHQLNELVELARKRPLAANEQASLVRSLHVFGLEHDPSMFELVRAYDAALFDAEILPLVTPREPGDRYPNVHTPAEALASGELVRNKGLRMPVPPLTSPTPLEAMEQRYRWKKKP